MIEFNVSDFNINEIQNWCLLNLSGRWRVSLVSKYRGICYQSVFSGEPILFIEREDDAVLFKLAWVLTRYQVNFVNFVKYIVK